MADRSKPPEQRSQVHVETIPQAEWERLMIEELGVMEPVFSALKGNQIPFAIAGSAVFAIEKKRIVLEDGTKLPFTDVDLLIPLEKIEQANTVLDPYLITKDDGQRLISPDKNPPSQSTSSQHHFSSAAWGQFEVNGKQGDVIADYAVHVGDGQGSGKQLVLGLTQDGKLKRTGLTSLFGPKDEIQRTVIPYMDRTMVRYMQISYVGSGELSEKYVFPIKERYWPYLKIAVAAREKRK